MMMARGERLRIADLAIANSKCLRGLYRFGMTLHAAASEAPIAHFEDTASLIGLARQPY
jgi:hypothetical protein